VAAAGPPEHGGQLVQVGGGELGGAGGLPQQGLRPTDEGGAEQPRELGEDPIEEGEDHGREHLLGRWRPHFFSWWDCSDARMAERPFADVLLDMNTEASALRGYGLSRVDEFQVGGPGEYPGADRVTGWFDRNLRIFANLQRITERRRATRSGSDASPAQ
jgi:hypothetical protein